MIDVQSQENGPFEDITRSDIKNVVITKRSNTLDSRLKIRSSLDAKFCSFCSFKT